MSSLFRSPITNLICPSPAYGSAKEMSNNFAFSVQKYTSAVDDGRVMKFEQPLLNRTLVNHVIKGIWVKSELSCKSFCFADDDCMSINLGPLRDKQHFCELSRSDHVLHPGDLKIRTGFKYNPVWVRMYLFIAAINFK